jgi:hypothetical protein
METKTKDKVHLSNDESKLGIAIVIHQVLAKDLGTCNN